MQVEIAKTTYEKVNLSNAQVRSIVQTYLRNLCSAGEYLRTIDGVVWLMEDDPDHRHGSIREMKVRQATEIDKAAFVLLDYIHKENSLYKSNDNGK